MAHSTQASDSAASLGTQGVDLTVQVQVQVYECAADSCSYQHWCAMSTSVAFLSNAAGDGADLVGG